MSACVGTIRLNRALADQLLIALPHVHAAEGQYAALGRVLDLWQLMPSRTIGGIDLAQQMTALYADRLSKLGSSVRWIYDDLKTAVRDGICPLCGHREIRTLDHYLPQEHFPIFAITPLNLVPCCSDCNHTKSSFYASSKVEQLLHPYFDEVDNERWLYAEVTPESPPAVIFAANPPDAWSEALKERLRLHFRLFRLGDLYSLHAGVEITDIRHDLKNRIFPSGGAEAVAAELQARALSYFVAQRNSWRGALFEALAQSEWFCENGFK